MVATDVLVEFKPLPRNFVILGADFFFFCAGDPAGFSSSAFRFVPPLRPGTSRNFALFLMVDSSIARIFLQSSVNQTSIGELPCKVWPTHRGVAGMHSAVLVSDNVYMKPSQLHTHHGAVVPRTSSCPVPGAAWLVEMGCRRHRPKMLATKVDHPKRMVVCRCLKATYSLTSTKPLH
jgi:hypothetical protein